MRTLGAKIRTLLLLVAAFAYVEGGGTALSATPQFCDTVCAGDVIACNTPCYVDQMAFDTDAPTTCGTQVSACCGDGACTAGEIGACETDCGTCGDPTCGTGPT
jgi:hypothetical protein